MSHPLPRRAFLDTIPVTVLEAIRENGDDWCRPVTNFRRRLRVLRYCDRTPREEYL